MKNLNEDDGIRVIQELPRYINGATVKVSMVEIFAEFNCTDGQTKETVSRIMMSPEVAKAVAIMLADAVQKFEQDTGKLRDIEKIFNRKAGVTMVSKATGGVQ